MKDNSSRVGAIIAAAGASQRTGIDKIFLSLSGNPVLAWSVETCQNCEMVNQIVIVLNENNLNRGQKLVAERRWNKVTEICLGGKRRQDSVKQGIERLRNCEWVVIHDGARPFLTPELIRNGLKAARKSGAAVAAVPVKQTIKVASDDGTVMETLNREQLWTVQTPQVFRFDIIARAYEQIVEHVTDDASLAEKLGYKVKLYMGDYNNIKITTPEDMALAEIIARNR